MLGRTLSMVLLATVAAGATAGDSTASVLNDWACQPSTAHPRPVVLVHGRGGTVDDFGPLVTSLGAAGYCVYGTNYGQVDGQGQYGVDHLRYSAAQLEVFLRQVRAETGATHVDLVGHSAGTGVIANLLLARGGGAYVHRAISFAGLHHPYAHAGVPGFLDNDLYLPNLIATARLVDPDITAQQVITAALAVYAAVGGSLASVDVETATSNFASDLFDPVYWAMLHGGLSETSTTYIKLAAAGRSLRVDDASPSVCYTNIVGVADLLTGPSAGFQDPAPNVDNFLLPTASDHAQILADPIAMTRALAALATTCPYAGAGDSGDPDDLADDGDGVPDDGDADGVPDSGGGGVAVGGCSASGLPASVVFGVLIAVSVMLLARRRRREVAADTVDGRLGRGALVREPIAPGKYLWRRARASRGDDSTIGLDRFEPRELDTPS